MLRPLKEELVSELVRSIKNEGLLQPVVVRRHGDGYELVFGMHRLEACRRLGLSHIIATVREFNDAESFLARVSENLLRNSFIDPLEEAEGYHMLLNMGYTINAIGRVIGKCDSYVCERLAILKRLSNHVQSRVSNGDLTASHAEVLCRIKEKCRQETVAELVVKNRLSVRSLEDILNGVPPPTKTQIQLIANEVCVRIPQEFVNAIGFQSDRPVFMYIRGNKLILENVTRRRRSHITKNRHSPPLLQLPKEVFTRPKTQAS